MPRYSPESQQAIQVMIWCLQLLLAHAPAVDPDWARHWTAILTSGRFAGEFWQDANGMAVWWARIMDDILDFVLTGRPDH
jgi:hypothetical protein